MKNYVNDTIIFLSLVVLLLVFLTVVNNSISCSGNKCIEVEKIDITEREEEIKDFNNK